MEFTGERFMPDSATDYDIAAEHIHRYNVAALCVKDKIVIDIASGEGYGSAILADFAKEVYGFDIAEEAVKHASDKYKKSNLKYAKGDICNIPMEDGTADIVISFETIEHVDKISQKKFISEVKRVLKKDGILIISTPNKKVVEKNNNTFHIHEMEYEEFSGLLNDNFKAVTMYYQQFEKNSVISGGGNVDLTLINSSFTERASHDNCTFFIAVCTNGNADIAPLNSLLAPGSRDIFDNYEKVLSWGNELDEIIIKQKADLKYLFDKAETLEKECKSLNTAVDAANNEKNELNTMLENANNRLTTLKEQLESIQANYRNTQNELTLKCEEFEQLKSKKDEEAQNYTNIINSLESVVSLREFELNNIRKNKVYQLLAAVYKLLKKIKQKLSGATPAPVVTQPVIEHIDNNVTKDTLVSIIIPVYNNYDYLRDCFDSAIRQTYKNVEIITVNDCSPDERVKPLLEEYANKYPNFHTYDNLVNQGICITTNTAMKKASGNWFAFLDCDDWLADDAIEKLMARISENPKALFGYSNRFNYDNDTKTCEEIDFYCRPTKNYRENLELGMYTTHLKLIHKKVFERVGNFDPYYIGTQDYDISLKAAFYFGDSIFAYLREPIYFHRVHSSQTTNTQSAKMIAQTQELVETSRKRQAVRDGSYNKKISFIILSFNKKEQTKECIESVYATVKMPFEIILFDNKSNDETVEFLKNFVKPLKEVKAYFSDKNIGAGKGRQTALKHATGDYFVMIDNDIVLQPDWLPEMIVRLEREDNVATVSAKVIFPDHKVQFSALKSHIADPFITFVLTGYMQPDSDLESCDWDNNEWLPGGATMYKAGIFDIVTGLEEYINCYEDNETGYQLQKKGYKLLNSPASVMIHNHFSYMGNKVEKEYVETRYNRENLVKSAFAFYRRNGLIIKDNFIFDIMGLAGKSDEEIANHFKQMLKDQNDKQTGKKRV